MGPSVVLNRVGNSISHLDRKLQGELSSGCSHVDILPAKIAGWALGCPLSLGRLKLLYESKDTGLRFVSLELDLQFKLKVYSSSMASIQKYCIGNDQSNGRK